MYGIEKPARQTGCLQVTRLLRSARSYRQKLENMALLPFETDQACINMTCVACQIIIYIIYSILVLLLISCIPANNPFTSLAKYFTA